MALVYKGPIYVQWSCSTVLEVTYTWMEPWARVRLAGLNV